MRTILRLFLAASLLVGATTASAAFMTYEISGSLLESTLPVGTISGSFQYDADADRVASATYNIQTTASGVTTDWMP